MSLLYIRSALQVEIHRDPAESYVGSTDYKPGEGDDESLCTYEDDDEAGAADIDDSDQVRQAFKLDLICFVSEVIFIVI